MNADGTGERKITDLGVLSWAPFFHPLGRVPDFRGPTCRASQNFELYLVDAAGERAPVRVTEREGFDGLATFSPDGKTISWTSNATSKKKSQIFIADWDHAAALALLDKAPPRQESAVPVLEKANDDITVEDLRTIVEALTAEEMAGRLTGTEGERLATAYVAEAFTALGLAPAGDGGTMFQSFEFTAGVDLAEGNALSVSVDGEAQSLELDKEWRPLAFARTGEAEEASVLFAGYGLVAPAQGEAPALDSYGELDRHGKMGSDLARHARRHPCRAPHRALPLRRPALQGLGRQVAGRGRGDLRAADTGSLRGWLAAPGLRSDLRRRRLARSLGQSRNCSPHALHPGRRPSGHDREDRGRRERRPAT